MNHGVTALLYIYRGGTFSHGKYFIFMKNRHFVCFTHNAWCWCCINFLTLLPRSSFSCGDKAKVPSRSSACSLSCHANFWQNIFLDIHPQCMEGWKLRWPTTVTGQDKKTRGEVAVRLFFLPWVSVRVLPWDFYFCSESFVLPWGYFFCRDSCWSP